MLGYTMNRLYGSAFLATLATGHSAIMRESGNEENQRG